MVSLHIITILSLISSVNSESSKGRKDSSQKLIDGQLPNSTKYGQIKEEDVIVTSPPINVNDELSSVSNKRYYMNPKPESVRIIHDLSAEIERLAHLDLGGEEHVSRAEPQINFEDGHTLIYTTINPSTGLHIKRPIDYTDSESHGVRDDLALYTDPFIFIPTALVYIVSLPLFSYFMCYGRMMSKESIPAISAFVLYFVSFIILRKLWIFGVLLSLSIASITYRIALKPLKKFRLGPKNIKNEPIGWILIIITYCIILSNLSYKLLFTTFKSIFLFLPRVIRAALPLYYVLFLALTSSVILTILITTVPTDYAQNSVLSLTCSYIVFSGVSYFNDLVVCNFWTKMRPLLLDPVQFFESDAVTNVNQLVLMIFMVATAVYTTKNIK